MEGELYEMLRGEGVGVTFEQLQGANRLIDRHLGSEIALAKWGWEGRAQRANRDDNVVQAAVDLLRRAPNQQELFTLGLADAPARP